MALQMRWTETLKTVTKNIKNGEDALPSINTEEDAIRYINYYNDQYIQYEEEMTFAQAERITKQIDKIAEYLQKKFPDMTKACNGEYMTKKDAESYDNKYKIDDKDAITISF